MLDILTKLKNVFKYRHFIDACLDSLDFTIKAFEKANEKFKNNENVSE